MRQNERLDWPILHDVENGSEGAECRLVAWRDHLLAHWQVRFGRLDQFPPFIHLRRLPYRLLRRPGVQVATPHGLVLHIPYGDWLVSQALQGVLYEQQTLSQVLKRIVSTGGLVVDGGAHIGLYTCLLADGVGPEGRVIAFEPNPQIISWLRKNIASNSVSERVDVVEAALWERSEAVVLNAPPYASTSATVVANDAGLKSPGCGSVTHVMGTALDDWLTKSYGRIPPIMLLKLDLEGGEARALEGAGDTIDSCQFIVLELNKGRSSGVERAQMVSRLSLAFDAFLVHEESRSVNQYDQARCEATLEKCGWVNVLLERRK